MPCTLFGIMYWLLFPSFMFSNWPAPINGPHLWYLPMIFLCMLVASIHVYARRRMPVLFVLVAYAFISFCGNVLCFRTFNEFFLYFPIFYMGFEANRSFVLRITRKKHSKVLLLLFCLLCVFVLRRHAISIHRLTAYYGAWSIVTFVSIDLLLKGKSIGKLALLLSKNSFTIYLLHQFIINSLLYLDFTHVDVYVCIIIVFAISLFLPFGIGYCYEHFIKDRIKSVCHL